MDRRQVKEAHVAEAVPGEQINERLGRQQLITDQRLKRTECRT